MAEYKLSLQSSSHCVGLSRAAYCYYKTPIYADCDAEVIKALNDLIERHPRWGF